MTLSTTFRLPVEGGFLTYDMRGEGPLVVCVPGMGDIRQGWDDLADALAAAGHRVVTIDLRGHGGSATTFGDLSRPAAGGDVLSLLDHLGDAAAHLIGCSYGASAVAHAAGTRPDAVRGLTLIGPFVRDLGPLPPAQRIALRLMLTRPWGPRAWAAWFRRLHRTAPPGLDARVAAVRRMLAEPGRLEALRAMSTTDLAEVDAALDRITTATLVVMGEADPDFPDPAAEASAIADRVGGEVLLVPGAGHYPHIERADLVLPRILEHVRATACHPAA